MPKIIMLKGLPASGKTTYANQLCKGEKYKRINKDDLRAMIDIGERSSNNEQMILKVRDNIIELYLSQGHNVVVDDTNLHEKHLQKFKEIAKKLKNVTVEVKEFNTPLHVCIERDKNRPNPVGSAIIIKMWREMVGVEKSQYDFTKKNCIVFDIDGTLAIMGDRSPYDEERVSEDEPNINLIGISRWLSESHEIIICSGRSESCREDTEKWLIRHGVIYKQLFMRGKEDKRKDREVKLNFAKEIMKDHNIISVFDDRDQVVAMRRAMGLDCFQVGYGGF